nr:MAG TPA: hypothetical protein [Caudoviricetes sp.]
MYRQQMEAMIIVQCQVTMILTATCHSSHRSQRFHRWSFNI